MTAQPTRVLAGFASLVVATVILAVLASRDDTRNSQTGDTRNKQTTLQADNPCGSPGAVLTTLDAVERAVPYQVVVPTAPEASLDTVKAMYQCYSTETLFVFDSGLTLSLEKNTTSDSEAATELKDFAAKDSVEAYMATVHGLPAAVIDPALDPYGNAAGSVTFARNGVMITLVGNHKLSAADLLRVASSLAPVS